MLQFAIKPKYRKSLAINCNVKERFFPIWALCIIITLKSLEIVCIAENTSRILLYLLKAINWTFSLCPVPVRTRFQNYGATIMFCIMSHNSMHFLMVSSIEICMQFNSWLTQVWLDNGLSFGHRQNDLMLIAFTFVCVLGGGAEAAYSQSFGTYELTVERKIEGLNKNLYHSLQRADTY